MEERVIQRGEKDEKNGNMETILCITDTDKVSDTESVAKGMVRVLPHAGHETQEMHLFSRSDHSTAVIFILAAFGLKMRNSTRQWE